MRYDLISESKIIGYTLYDLGRFELIRDSYDGIYTILMDNEIFMRTRDYDVAIKVLEHYRYIWGVWYESTRF